MVLSDKDSPYITVEEYDSQQWVDSYFFDDSKQCTDTQLTDTDTKYYFTHDRICLCIGAAGRAVLWRYMWLDHRSVLDSALVMFAKGFISAEMTIAYVTVAILQGSI